MLIITLIRIAITLTFLMLAAGGPYAIIQLRRYVTAHEELVQRVERLETARESEPHV